MKTLGLLIVTVIIGPIPWGHGGPLCHALSSLSLSMSWTSMLMRHATVLLATSGEWAWGGSQWRMGPTFLQMLLVLLFMYTKYCFETCKDLQLCNLSTKTL